jgi:8-oxo-dGTP pyrophosphatase MutT (NUDIX family)
MKFANKPNKPKKIVDGTIIWNSRSCAVVSLIAAYHEDDIWVALNKRGAKTPDYQGHWCLPCGYVDWDETIYDAARREIWEELGLDIEEHSIITNRDKQPWWVNSSFNTEKQNISLYYNFCMEPYCLKLPVLTGENSDEGEVEDVGWFRIDEAQKMDLAFNHKDIILRWRRMAKL